MEALGHNSRWRRGWITGIVGVLILVIVAGCDAGTTRPVAVATATATPTATATATATPTATPTAAPIYYYQDTLLAPAPGWDTDGNCYFAYQAYYPGFWVNPNVACQTPVRGLGDVDVSVRMTHVGGALTDLNGIEVRRSGNPASLYEFDIAANGAWVFKVCIGGFDHCNILTSGSNPAIYTGSNAVNTVEVRAVGSHFALLVNGTQVGQADDATLANGDIWLDTGGTSWCAFADFVAKRP